MKKSLKILSLILVMAMMVSMLSGCGAVKKAENAVNTALTALKTLDFDAASEYINIDEIVKENEKTADSITLDDKTIMGALFGKLDYAILSSEKIDKNTVTVKTQITAIDMKSVLSDFIVSALQYAFSTAFNDPQPTEEEQDAKMQELFVASASKDGLATVTKEVDIKVVKTEGKWKIEMSDELSDALLGGIVSAADELSKSFGADEKSGE